MSDPDTLENRLESKLKNGEITQEEYNNLYAKFESLGILTSKKSSQKKGKRVTGSGSTIIEGGDVNGAVNIMGRAIIDSSLMCNSISISGKATVDGDLTVRQKASVFGELVIHGDCRFGSNSAISGILSIDNDWYATVKSSISGKVEVGSTITTDGPIIVSGKLYCHNLRSSSSIKIEGDIDVGDSVVAKDFECIKGRGEIDNDLKAEMVRIFTNYRTFGNTNEKQSPDGDIVDMISNVVNNIFPSIIDGIAKSLKNQNDLLKIGGDIEGSVIDISHCIVRGDIIGDRVSIGPNTVVEGTIYYKEFIEFPEGSAYTVVKVKDQ